MTLKDIDFNAADLAKSLDSRDFESACAAADRMKYALVRGEEIDRDTLLMLIRTVQATMKRLTPRMRRPTTTTVRITDPRPGPQA